MQNEGREMLNRGMDMFFVTEFMPMPSCCKTCVVLIVVMIIINLYSSHTSSRCNFPDYKSFQSCWCVDSVRRCYYWKCLSLVHSRFTQKWVLCPFLQRHPTEPFLNDMTNNHVPYCLIMLSCYHSSTDTVLCKMLWTVSFFPDDLIDRIMFYKSFVIN